MKKGKENCTVCTEKCCINCHYCTNKSFGCTAPRNTTGRFVDWRLFEAFGEKNACDDYKIRDWNKRPWTNENN